MKRFAIVLMMLALAGAARLDAYDWAAANLAVDGEEKENGRTVLTLKDGEGKVFVLGYDTEPTDAIVQRILKLKNYFSAWKYIKIGRMGFEYSKDVLEISLIPSEFLYKGINVLDYLPAGLLFSHYDTMYYNYRITRDKMFIRVYGEYVTEEELCEKTIAAISDPLAYVRARDPEYLLQRLDRLVNAMMAFESKGVFGSARPIERSVVQRIVAIKRQNPVFKRRDIVKALEKEKISVSEKAVGVVLGVYYNEFE
ncbi:MAG TPA: hypothetical protein VLM75_10285 [Spirochaetota bacterium]|nr:hypothetical protein [Spirochaetota bacterium]